MVSDEATSSSKNDLTTAVDNCGNQQTEANFNRPLRWFKLVCGTASTAGFIYGLRVAWIHSKLKPGELPRTNLLSGAGLAMQAFGLASLITISGYISFVVLISEVMGVNTLKEFGTKTKLMFGDRFRISKGKDENYESLSDLFEKFQK
uniref:Transmembrane protein 242 n=1 Tax=Meloidogyne floridensis TaxID=298350 RepID=A0A915NT03_9BILA